MLKMTLVPAMGDVTSFIWSSHPRPWKTNYGTLKRSYIMSDGTIYIDFKIEKSEVESTEDWSVQKNGFILEVYDAKGIPVMENWILFDKTNIINATMCLKEMV
jgi:hypothetical protein